MSDDKSILVEALKIAVPAHAKEEENKSHLGAMPPSDEILDPLAEAIGKCASFQAIAGQMIFSGNAGPVMQEQSLTIPLLYRGKQDIEKAAEWLIRVFTTEKAVGVFKAAIWGLSVDKKIALSKDTKLTTSDHRNCYDF